MPAAQLQKRVLDCLSRNVLAIDTNRPRCGNDAVRHYGDRGLKLLSDQGIVPLVISSQSVTFQIDSEHFADVPASLVRYSPLQLFASIRFGAMTFFRGALAGVCDNLVVCLHGFRHALILLRDFYKDFIRSSHTAAHFFEQPE